ncbi:MAG: molybdopterin-synthase adenylyltransferase MoeB [Bacteroidota bacterium]
MSDPILLSPSELARYSRQMTIPEFNIAGQKKLKAARVLVVGAGGLGSPLLFYLVAAGVGHIGIVDFDVVEESNLQRQILFNVDDVGKSKAETARRKLQKLNPHVNIKVYNTTFTSNNALKIIEDYDVVADGSDNFPTRYLVNDACVISGKVNVYASIFRFEGQLSVFNYPNKDGTRGPNYRDLFPTLPPVGTVPNCAEGGVLGVLPGILGSMQASEVIKVITGVGEPLAGRLFLLDAASFTTRVLKLKNTTSVKITELIDYEKFCGINSQQEMNIQTISVAELKKMMDAKEDFQLIDVREPYEYDLASLGGKLIPLYTLDDHVAEISKNKKVVIHCKTGKRSIMAIKKLQRLFAFQNLYNLEGGIAEYRKKIDMTIPIY